jgi:anti-anti-sigma factor
MSEIKVINLPEKFDFSFHREFTEHSKVHLSDTSCTSIMLDFSRVNYLDSSALGMMVLLHKKAKKINIVTGLRGAKGVAADILEMANLNQLYDFS